MKMCYNCGKTINVEKDCYLLSHPNIFRTRYRCLGCGKHHKRFLKAEFMEKWYNCL